MGRVYLLSSMIIPLSFEYELATLTIREVSVEEARGILKRGFTSAVGHEPTARFLSRILNLKVEVNRETVYIDEGDVAITIQFRERIQKIELTEEEVAKYFREGRARLIEITINSLKKKMKNKYEH
jgi:hypothetical protein